MDDVIGRLDANIGVDRAAAEKAVGIVAHCSVGHSRAAMACAFTRRSAGAGWAINAAQTISHSGVVLGALDGVVPAGVRVTHVVARTSIANAREQAGKNAAGVIAGAAPRVSHYV